MGASATSPGVPPGIGAGEETRTACIKAACSSCCSRKASLSDSSSISAGVGGAAGASGAEAAGVARDDGRPVAARGGGGGMSMPEPGVLGVLLLQQPCGRDDIGVAGAPPQADACGAAADDATNR